MFRIQRLCAALTAWALDMEREARAPSEGEEQGFNANKSNCKDKTYGK